MKNKNIFCWKKNNNPRRNTITGINIRQKGKETRKQTLQKGKYFMCLHLLQKLQEYLHCLIMASGLSSHDSAIAISYKQWYLSISSSQGSDLMSVESDSIIT